MIIGEDCAFWWYRSVYYFQAEAVVLTLRDLFQIIFERKKKEMEEAKKQQTEGTTEEKPNPNGKIIFLVYVIHHAVKCFLKVLRFPLPIKLIAII